MLKRLEAQHRFNHINTYPKSTQLRNMQIRLHQSLLQTNEHQESRHIDRSQIFTSTWPTSTDYQANQHIWYVSGSEILAVWLRKGDRSSDMEGGGWHKDEHKDGEQLWRKKRRRILVWVHGLAVACWQETTLQLECLISTASKPKCLGKSFLASHGDTFTHKHDPAINLETLKQIFTPPY